MMSWERIDSSNVFISRGLAHIPKKKKIVPFLAEMLQPHKVKQKFFGKKHTPTDTLP
jgi:hypothetical protein